jgi:hypothetical protein
MASPITQQYKEELGLLDNFAKEIESEWLAATTSGDNVRANEAMQLFQKLEQEERPKIDQKYQDLQIQRKGELINGIASGDLITDKRTVSATPTTYGEFYQPSEEELTRTKTVANFNPKKTKSVLSELLEVPENKIELDGLGTGITTELEMLGDPAAMEYYLKEKLKYPNVIPMTINGKPNFIVEDPTGVDFKTDQQNKYKVVFKNGIQLGDVTGFVAANTLPIVASIVGGIGGGVAGTAGTPVGSGAGAVAGSAALYGLVTGAQRGLVRDIAGVPINAEQILKQTGQEMLLGAAIDTATLGTGTMLGLGKIGRETLENPVNKSTREAVELLNKKGYNVTSPLGGQFEREIAGGSPNMEVAKKMYRQQAIAADFKQALQDGAPVRTKVETVGMLKKDLEDMVAGLSSKEERIAGLHKEFVDRRIAKLMPDETDWIEAGKGISDVLTRGQATTRQIKNTEFDNFAKAANDAGVMQTPEELADILRPIVANSDLGRNPGVEQIMVRLGNARQDAKLASELEGEIARADAAGLFVPEQARIRLKDLKEYSEPFDAVRSRNLIQNLQNQVEKDMYGASKSDVVVANSTAAVRNNFAVKLEQAGLKNEWDKFKDAYVDYSAYEKGDIGKMLTDSFGDLKIAPEEILKRSLKDTKSVNDILNAAKAAGDVQGEAYLRSTMQKAFLEDIGLTSRAGLEVNEVKLDGNKGAMIDVLFGAEAPRIKSSLVDLNKALSTKGVTVANIKPEAAERLLKPLPLNERKQLIDEIVEKASIQKQYEQTLKNGIIKKAKAGDFDMRDSGYFGEVLLDARPSDVAEIVAKMKGNPKMQQDSASDAIAAFFNRFAPKQTSDEFMIKGGDKAGSQLWDTKAVIDEVGEWKRGKPNMPKFVANIDLLTGDKEMADKLIAFSRQAEANRPFGQEIKLGLRMMASETGAKLYLNPLDYSYHKILATAYGSNKLKPLLTFLMKNTSEESQQKAMQDMVRGIVTTRTGIQAAMQQAQNDPEFSEQFQNIMLKVKEDIDRERQQQR